MLARFKKLTLCFTLLALLATLGVGLTATGAGAASRAGASFDKGATGWHAGTRATRVALIKRGKGHAVAISARRAATAVLVSRANLVRSSKAGQRYTVSALVRSTRPGVLARMVLRETVGGSLVASTGTAFRPTPTWQKVTLAATARRAPSNLGVRVTATRLRGKQYLFVDNVSVVPVAEPAATFPPLPVPLPIPLPTPTPEPTPEPDA